MNYNKNINNHYISIFFEIALRVLFLPFILIKKTMAKSIKVDLNNDKLLEKISFALSSPVRRKIIKLSTEHGYSINELASKLHLPVSTISTSVKILKEAGLVTVTQNPNIKGNNKVVYQLISEINIDLAIFYKNIPFTQILEIPVGTYASFYVEPTCGLVNSQGLILGYDDPRAFLSPDRFSAQLVYFSKGFVEYTFPIQDDEKRRVSEISVSLEICSEAPMWNPDWKSDITFWVNGNDVGTFRSLSDYGDRKGIYTPSSWPSNATQYGMLTKLCISKNGCFINGQPSSTKKISDINFSDSILKFKIGFKENAQYVGGVNIFGKGFGDSAQGIIFQITYEDKNA